MGLGTGLSAKAVSLLCFRLLGPGRWFILGRLSSPFPASPWGAERGTRESPLLWLPGGSGGWGWNLEVPWLYSMHPPAGGGCIFLEDGAYRAAWERLSNPTEVPHGHGRSPMSGSCPCPDISSVFPILVSFSCTVCAFKEFSHRGSCCPVPCITFSSSPGPYPLDASNPHNLHHPHLAGCDHQKCPQANVPSIGLKNGLENPNLCL